MPLDILVNFDDGSQESSPDTISVFTNSIQLKEIYNKNNTLYSEVYLEFVNGFKGKIAFNKSDNNEY